MRRNEFSGWGRNLKQSNRHLYSMLINSETTQYFYRKMLHFVDVTCLCVIYLLPTYYLTCLASRVGNRLSSLSFRFGALFARRYTYCLHRHDVMSPVSLLTFLTAFRRTSWIPTKVPSVVLTSPGSSRIGEVFLLVLLDKVRTV